MVQQNIKKYFLSFPEKIYFFTQYKIHAEMSQKYTDFVKINVTFDFLVLGCWKSIGNKPSILSRSSLNSSMIGSRTKKLRFFYGEILAIFSYFAHIFLIYLHRKKNQVWEKIMQLILFVELCSEMSSRMIFGQINLFAPLFGYLQNTPKCQ